MHHLMDSAPLRVLFIVAALVVVVAGAKAAQPILVPFLLSGFIAIIAVPPMVWLHRRKAPWWLAMTLVVLAILLAVAIIGGIVGASVAEFHARIPDYQNRLKDEAAVLVLALRPYGVQLPDNGFADYLDPGAALGLAGRVLSGFGNVLTDGVLILLTVIFILLEAAALPTKLRAIFDNPETSLGRLSTIAANVQRYMEIKTVISVLTGLLIGIWTSLLGVDFPIVLGLLAFFLNYVPNIGSMIAAVPAVLLAFIELGIGPAAVTGLGYVVVNTVMGNIIEPRFMGRGLGLSTLVVFLSLLFWGWVLGPVGMLLSVPLTMTVKIALDANEQSRWLAILLGSDVKSGGQG